MGLYKRKLDYSKLPLINLFEMCIFALKVSGSMSDVLNSVNVTIISDEECNTAYATSFNPNPVHPSMMCAGSPDGGVDACTGDAGGPLFTNENGKFIQHGIVSWGRGCALAQYPGVYTQVSYFLEWIAGYKK